MANPDSSDHLANLAEKAAVAPRHLLEPFFKESAKEILLALAGNPNLQERDLLRLLERKDLPAEVLRAIAAHKEAARNYGVRLALARHPRTPRLVSLPILKFLYLFDLVRVTQTPAAPADVKMVAEETILRKVETIPRGERITLARRSSGRVAAGLLFTQDRELILAALNNPFLTEAHLMKILTLDSLPAIVVQTIAHHEKWSHRYYLRLALIRNPLTPFQQVLGFIPDIAVTDLREICLDRRMPEPVRLYIASHCLERLQKKPPSPPRTEG